MDSESEITISEPADKGTRRRVWVFTLNNYTEEDQQKLRTLAGTDPSLPLKWIAWAREVGASGTPHLQGVFSCKRAINFAPVKKALGIPAIHLEGCKSLKGALEYIRPISKGGVSRTFGTAAGKHFKPANLEGTYEEHGTIDTDGSIGGKRTLQEWYDFVSECTSLKEFEAFKHPFKAMPSYISTARHIIQNNINQLCVAEQAEYLSSSPLRLWQSKLLKFLDNVQPDYRRIVWVNSVAGGVGKTYFAYYLESKGYQLLPFSKSSDIARLIDVENTKFCLDLSREFTSEKDFTPYSFLESVKNGFIPNPKYDGIPLRLRKNIVVVFANQDPITASNTEGRGLSKDRIYLCCVDLYNDLTIMDLANDSLVNLD